MSSVLGTVSKTSLMSFVAKRVRCTGVCAFRTSCRCCVSVTRRVSVKFSALKPYCNG